MSANDVVTEVQAWVEQTIPELVMTYGFVPTQKGDLPDVVVELTATSIQAADPSEFPMFNFQQIYIRRFELSLSFMIENNNPELAATTLRSWDDDLTAQVLQDGTLGGRVHAASPFIDVDYTAPFIEYADGTRGREMNMTLVVAQPLEGQQ